MLRLLNRFEAAVNVTLLVLMAIVVTLATIDLGWVIFKAIVAPPFLRLDVNELLGLFSAFFLVLIGVELLETVKIYVTEKTVHVELIIAVGLVALARKVIILDPKELDGASLAGIAAVIAALAGAYYVVRSANRRHTGA